MKYFIYMHYKQRNAHMKAKTKNRHKKEYSQNKQIQNTRIKF